MRPPLSATAAAGAGLRLLLAALLLCSVAILTVQSAKSTIKIRGSNFTVQPNVVAVNAQDIEDLSALQFSVSRGGVGLYERADFVSAYMANDTLQLIGGSNPLESSVKINANNSYIRINTTPPQAYESLELVLHENNTLEVSGASLTFNRSTVTLHRNNWVYLVNGSTTDFQSTVLNMSDYFTWWLDASGVKLNNSFVSITDVQTWWGTSSINAANSTLAFSAVGVPAPSPRYVGKLRPVLYVAGSTVNLTQSLWSVQSIPLHMSNSAVSLDHAILTLTNSTARWYDVNLQLRASEFSITNSSVFFNSNVTAGRTISAIKVYSNETADGTDTAVGSVLGTLPLTLINADADIEFED